MGQLQSLSSGSVAHSAWHQHDGPAQLLGIPPLNPVSTVQISQAPVAVWSPRDREEGQQ